MAPCALNFEVTPEVGSPRIGLRPTTGQATAWLHRIIGDALGCHYEGELRMPSVRAEISILPVAHKRSPNQPGYRVRLDGIEVGAPVSIAPISPRGRSMRRSRARGAADDLRQTRRAGGQTPPRVFALIWNLHLESLRRASQHATVLHERVQQPTRGFRSGRRGADAPRSAR